MAINLLFSFQEKKDRIRKKIIRIALIFLILNFIFILAFDLFLQKTYKKHVQENAILTFKMKQVSTLYIKSKQIKRLKNSLAGQLVFIKELELSSFLTIYLLNHLSSISQEWYLTRIQRQSELVLVEGFLNSKVSISHFLTKIKKNEWIEKVRLIELKKNKSLFLRYFKLSFHLKTKAIFAGDF